MAAPVLLAPRPAEKILDLCAAPGGKATHIAEIAGDRAEIYALDQSADRLLIVDQGKIIESGAPRALIEKHLAGQGTLEGVFLKLTGRQLRE